MATLTVWKFDTQSGADEASETLQGLAKQNLIVLHDAATRVVGARQEEAEDQAARQHHRGRRPRRILLGTAVRPDLLRPPPWRGDRRGDRRPGGSLTDVGIDDGFINKVRDQITPGTSALFVMSSDAVIDKVKAAFAEHEPSELIFTNLSNEQENALRSVFAE